MCRPTAPRRRSIRGSGFSQKLTVCDPFGLFDMAGNVWEWVLDCQHSSYEGAPTDGSAWLTGNCDRRVHRGGSWFNRPEYLQSDSRIRGAAGLYGNSLGFRVARTLGP